MMGRWLLVLPALVLLCPVRLCAQGETKPPAPLLKFRAADSANADRMYEDIEIFRRILDRKLHPLYPRINYAQSLGGMMGMPLNQFQGNFQGGMVAMQGGMMGMPGVLLQPAVNTIWHQEISETLEGVYLKGQGVVYTATLSSLQPPSRTKANDWEKGLKLARPVSEWESIRRQLHNEKEEQKKPEASKPLALTDELLKALAENGHHFSQLSEKESLTLVLTVRETNPPTPARQSANETKKPMDPRRRGEEGASFVDSKVRDLELLGDLHMKQEHYGQARDAFRKAIELAEGQKQQAVLARKLAQAFLMLGNIEEARTALDQALKLTKEDGEKKDKPAPTAKPTAELPVKVIISAPKKLLDEVKEGKITFEEFRSRAHVETLRFDERRSHK